MTPSEAIKRSLEVANWLTTELNDLPIDASLRNDFSARCLVITQDHHYAICLLLDHEIFASAFALIRVQFDSYIRGIWLADCATDKQVKDFANGKEPRDMKNMGNMVSALKKVEPYQGGQLSKIHSESWDAMNSYTHTGSLQVQNWLTADAIEQNYPPEKIVEAANFSGAISLLSGVRMAALAKDDALGQRLLERMKAYAQREF